VIIDDVWDKVPPLEIYRIPELSVTSSKELTNSSIPTLHLALRLRMASRTTVVDIAEAAFILFYPVYIHEISQLMGEI
jgi:hypothetical protein